MVILMIFLFVIGYILIASEHIIKINKAAAALLTGTILWIIYAYAAPELIPLVSPETFQDFLLKNPSISDLPYAEQCLKYIVEHQIIESTGEICETLIFLTGAMLTVELVDSHGGFMFITNHITTHNKKRMLILISIITFFMSAILDNLTTSIVMVMLIRKLVGNYKERWVFGSMVIIAANSGGAWSPIGDVTTIMLWLRGNISTSSIIPNLFLPSLVSAVIPLLLLLPRLSGNITSPNFFAKDENEELLRELNHKDRLSILILGVLCLLFVPVFKSVTHLPPFMGILLGVGILWVFTEIMYRSNRMDESIKLRLSKVIRKLDGATLLFFLGILLAVEAMRYAGILTSFSVWLDNNIGNIYLVNFIIGVMSAIVDNVPLVASAIAMYPVATDAMVAAAADPAYMAYFVQDGIFWQFLAYCAGVGGSMLIIGSAAGVVVMGLERINFIWYLKNITIFAFWGYLAGALVYVLQNFLLAL